MNLVSYTSMLKPISISAFFLFFFFFPKKESAFAFQHTSETNTKFQEHIVDSTLLAPFANDNLTAFYRLNNFKTVWNNPQNRQLATAILSNASAEGLDAAEYLSDDLPKLESKIASLSESELVQYDISMTLAVQKYLLHMNSGKLNPKKLYDDWDLTPENFDINKNLTDAISGDSLAVIFENIQPKNLVYKRLKNALSILNAMPVDNLKDVEIVPKLKPNASHKSIIDLKKRLIYWNDMKPKDSLTAIYDEETIKAVKKFQARHGLVADGIIGNATITALNTTKEERKQQVIANLERWRWFPKELADHHIIINIPEYKLHTVFKKDTTRTHNIIVGTQMRKTPILYSKLNTTVFNPTWTVPPTILKEDIIPETIKNRDYLRKKNIKIYDYKNNVISVWKWNPEKANNYRYVQSPGTFNSLGMVKILFPNDYAVYLHDTNHKEYFEKTNRSLSSGCVRVQNPLELTEYLLNDSTNWNLEKITETLKTEKTQNVKIKSDIYIYQLYWTAWSDCNTLQFRPDIYNLDSELFCLLRN